LDDKHQSRLGIEIYIRGVSRQEKLMRRIPGSRVLWVALVLGVGLLVFSFAGWFSPAAASVPQFATVDIAHPEQIQSPENSTCLFCHEKTGISRSFSNGDILPVTFDTQVFSESVHQKVACSTCHADIASFPHQEMTAQSLREYSLQRYTICKDCHAEQFQENLDSVHMREIASGDFNAAICTDCHNPHSQKPITGEDGNLFPEARLEIPERCARCHSVIYEAYEQSVHGSSLSQENNPDVPTCTDCHGVHNITDPRTNQFRINSPLLCAQCHTDQKVMDKYGLSTQVLNTYVADFHGTTVTLFEKTAPDQATNKPVCYDCHGIHNIKKVDDPVYGLRMKQNILIACQKCHADATENFPDAWMSHYIPNEDKYPLVFYVNLFYKFFIPGVLGAMAVFVLSDIARRLIERFKGAKRA
jgi:predicted CXXCH cytochrome family protein